MRLALPVVLLLSASRVSAAAPSIAIEHRPVACVVADRFPVVTARVEPADQVARARVMFRATGTPDWYFVEMQREKQAFRGTLPKPLKATSKIEYYIDAVDRSMGEFRTAEYGPAVVSGAGDCPSKMLTAAVLTSAKVAVGSLASGVTALPAGFSSAGILGGSVAAAAGGGALKAVLIVAGAAAAAGGALAVKQATEDDDVVKSYAIEGFAVSFFGQGGRLPHAGAVVSSSLDSVTTTTDSQGRFALVPSTPCHTKSNPRGDPGGVAFTLTITAAGCPTFSRTQQFGCAQVGQFPPQDFNMNCPGNAR